jgi:hypothetical protein
MRVYLIVKKIRPKNFYVSNFESLIIFTVYRAQEEKQENWEKNVRISRQLCDPARHKKGKPPAHLVSKN